MMTRNLPERVCVVGESSMGTTLAHVVASVGRPCTLWCHDAAVARAIAKDRRHPRFFPETAISDTLATTASLEEAVREAELVIVAVPSATFRSVARLLGAVLGPRQAVLSATKGLDPETHERMTELLRAHTPAERVGAIGGANITPEIMRGLPTAVVIASSSVEVLEMAERALTAPKLFVHQSTNLVGLELLSAFKNVVAIGVGIGIGLRWGTNATSFALASGLHEVKKVIAKLGGDLAAVVEAFGLADLYLTCTQPASLNRQIGVRLGEGEKLEAILPTLPEVPEGINSVRAFCALARLNGMQPRIAGSVLEIMQGRLEATAFEERVFGQPLQA